MEICNSKNEREDENGDNATPQREGTCSPLCCIVIIHESCQLSVTLFSRLAHTYLALHRLLRTPSVHVFIRPNHTHHTVSVPIAHIFCDARSIDHLSLHMNACPKPDNEYAVQTANETQAITSTERAALDAASLHTRKFVCSVTAQVIVFCLL